jgi:hypothetical protein
MDDRTPVCHGRSGVRSIDRSIRGAGGTAAEGQRPKQGAKRPTWVFLESQVVVTPHPPVAKKRDTTGGSDAQRHPHQARSVPRGSSRSHGHAVSQRLTTLTRGREPRPGTATGDRERRLFCRPGDLTGRSSNRCRRRNAIRLIEISSLSLLSLSASLGGEGRKRKEAQATCSRLSKSVLLSCGRSGVRWRSSGTATVIFSGNPPGRQFRRSQHRGGSGASRRRPRSPLAGRCRECGRGPCRASRGRCPG